MSASRRSLRGVVVIGAAAGALALGSASLESPAGAAPPAVSQEPDPCDTDGVSASYVAEYRFGNPPGYHVDAVNINDIAPNCSASTVLVRLLEGGTTLASGGPVAVSGATTSVDISGASPARQVTSLYVEIRGVPVPDECIGMSFDITGQFSNGNDHVSGGAQRDLIAGRGGNDQLKGAAGDDCLNGADGNDKLDGGAGNDRLVGGAGNDGMTGGAGNDRLYGGAGNDNLDGGAGNDVCVGGAGSTVYKNCEVKQ